MTLVAEPLTVPAWAFFDGGASYNLWSFVVTAAGAVVTIAGVGIVIYQIRKTRAAAEAASDAATDTSDKLLSVGAMIDLTRLYSVSNEAVVLLRHDNFAGAALRMADLRAKVVELRVSPKGRELQPPKKWQMLVTEVISLQEALEQYDGRQETDDALERRMKREMSAIHDKVNALAASTEHSVGEL